MMYRYRRIMVGLDFTPMDKALIEYVSFLATLVKPERIYFVNGQEGLEEPEELLADYPELDEPIDEKFKKEIELEIEQYYKPVEGTEVRSMVLVGDPSEELLDYVQIKDIDLLIVGRKRELRGTGVVPQKLARKIPASILFVPENSKLSLSTILVPLDFSDSSRMALEEAVELAEQNPGHNEIITLHTYKLPSGYYKTGKTEEEFAAIMHANVVKKHGKFMAATDTKGNEIRAEHVYDPEHSVAEVVNRFAHRGEINLIVIGGKGRTGTSAFFLGSTAEKLIALDNDIPLLVVKDKKATFGFLEMLKRL